MDFLTEFRWRPAIGDASVVGWLTVAAYALGAVLATLASGASRSSSTPPGRRGSSGVWLAVALGMTLLGINKQLDLQSLLTDIGRVVARRQGWYGHRMVVQTWFVVSVLVGAPALAYWAVRRFPDFWMRHRLLATGWAFLITFIVVRAVSFHHVDAMLGTRVFGFKANWAIELTGIALITVAAVRECSIPYRSTRQPGST